MLVTGCAGCEFRLGQTWTADRLASRREPHLREHVPRERIALVSADPGQEVLVKAALQRLQQRFHPDNAAMAVERANG